MSQVFDGYTAILSERVVTEDIIFEMVNNDGKIYASNFSLGVSEPDEIVPASVVFDFEHPDFSPTNRVFREQTPPSPDTIHAWSQIKRKGNDNQRDQSITTSLDVAQSALLVTFLRSPTPLP
ncbi:hypothetical protein B0H13DRAFT_2284269 [Mycena leptocephala]|nr:hypothetical protein B0H13DRAFT_2284269 [Mycena leptocephala]